MVKVCVLGAPRNPKTRAYASKAAGPLTVGVQEFGDPQLTLGDPEGLRQVLLVASGSGLGQVHHIGPQRIQDGEEDHATPPAGFEILYIQRAAGSGGNGRGFNGEMGPTGLAAARARLLVALLPDPQQQRFLGRDSEAAVERRSSGGDGTAAGRAAGQRGARVQTGQRLHGGLTGAEGEAAGQLLDLRRHRSCVEHLEQKHPDTGVGSKLT